MNIIFVDYYKPEDNNGICAYRKNLMRFLSNRKEVNLIMVSVLCTNKRAVTIERKNGITFVDLPYDLVPKRRVTEMEREFVGCIIGLLRQGESVVVHINWMNHAFVAPFLRQQIPKCKIVLTKHCVSWRENVVRNFSIYRNIEAALNSEDTTQGGAFVKRMLRDEVTFFSLVDHIITVTDDALRVVTKLYGVPETKVTRIYNGTDLATPNQSVKSELRRKFGFRENDKIILFVGGLTVLKGLHLLLPIVERLAEQDRDIRLVICGAGHFQDVMAMVPMSIAGKVTFMGNVPKDKLADIYQIADIGVIPSMEEQCSYVALEIMQAGLPLLISDVPGLRELLPNDMSDGLLPVVYKNGKQELDFSISETRLKRLLYDKELVPEYKRKLADNLAERFDIIEMCEKTLLVYNSLALESKPIKIHQEIPNQMVSVVIPCYNAESTIRESIMSVIKQSGVPNLEVIVVDDRSTDKSIEVLRSIKDDRLQIICNDSNLGVAETLNVGIRRAKGGYIARLDADDMMLPGRLFKQAKFLNEHPEYSIVGSNMLVADKNMNIINTICYPETDQEISWSRFFFNPFGHPAVMIRRDLFEQLTYSSEYPYCEDYHLWQQALKKCRGYNLQEFLTVYRLSDTSVSVTNSEAQHESAVRLMITEIESILGRDLEMWESKLIGAINIGAPKAFWQKYETEMTRLVDEMTEMVADNQITQLQVSLLKECAKLNRL